MIVGIMQPYFMPYIGYFQLINSVDKFVILDDVNFIRRGWANRNCILSNGQKRRFTIPLIKQSQNKLFNEIYTNNEFHNFLEMIRHSYCKTPYYQEIVEIINNSIFSGQKLCDIAIASIREICDYLSVDTEILISSELDKDNSHKGEKRIIEICNHLNASRYINPIGGKGLYCRKSFAAENIELKFINPVFREYPQPNTKEFIPGLSIIDVMMNCDKDTIKKMLSDYTLT